MHTPQAYRRAEGHELRTCQEPLSQVGGAPVPKQELAHRPLLHKHPTQGGHEKRAPLKKAERNELVGTLLSADGKACMQGVGAVSCGLAVLQPARKVAWLAVAWLHERKAQLVWVTHARTSHAPSGVKSVRKMSTMVAMQNQSVPSCKGKCGPGGVQAPQQCTGTLQNRERRERTHLKGGEWNGCLRKVM